MTLQEQKQKATGLVGRAKAALAGMRSRWPVFDHLVRTVLHYAQVQGNVLAGAVTFFGFLSFFPILALAFAVIAYVAAVYPDAEEALVRGISKVLPELIGPEDGQISVETFKDAAGAAGVIGLAGLLYSGLGWLSGMRQALQAAFVLDQHDKRNFVVGKGVDLLVLAIIGLTLILSVSVSGVITGFSEALFDWIGIAGSPPVQGLLWTLSFVVGIAASVLLFFVMYRLLPAPDLPTSALVKGAILAALLFELLKRLAFLLFAQAASSPGAAVLGIALVLVIWINYFSRVVMLGAAWAYTTPEAVAAQEVAEFEESTQIQYIPVAGARPLAQARLEARRQRKVDRISLASGVAIGAVSGAVATMLRRRT